MKNPFCVVVTGDSLVKDALDLLTPKCRLVFTGTYPDPSVLSQKVNEENADALILRTGKITAEVIKASENLKVITKHGAGYDNIDVAAATALGIPVMVAATANYESVAELVFGLMFSLARDIPWLDSRMRQGYWDKMKVCGLELFGKTLGLIGFGRIGRRVVELVRPLQMKIRIYDPWLKDDELPAEVVRDHQVDSLLKEIDILSLHCPLTVQTKNMIGKSAFEMMKKSAWVINTARGEVIDQDALIEALHDGQIAGAALDTFRKEPPEDLRRLCEAGKLVLTPHVGAATHEAQKRMGIEAANNILSVLEGRVIDRSYVINKDVLVTK
jgi:D-3-phosphoglycerate dehydrogenase / 2-oxoglutarate reductase